MISLIQDYVKGIFRKTIYKSDKGYIIGLLKVTETNILELKEYTNKVLTFTGYFDNLADE